MNPTLRDLDDDFFFDSESRSLAFHQMRKPTVFDVVGFGVLAAVVCVVAAPFMVASRIVDGIAKLTGRA